MIVYQDIKKLSRHQFSKIVAGSFFQMKKDGLMQLQHALKDFPGETLIIDVYPTPGKHRRQVLLSEEERKLLIKQSGCFHFISLDKNSFGEFYRGLNAESIRKPHISHPDQYLCGLSENGIQKETGEFNNGSLKDFGNWVQKLGYIYPVSGKVVLGNQIGRTLGFPTANISLDEPNKITPPMGVYAGWVKCARGWYKAMINIGIRPTLDLNNVTIEAHLFGFDGNLYDQNITIHFYHRIRDEMRFPSLVDLKKQLEADQLSAHDILSKLKYVPEKEDFILLNSLK